MSGKLQHPLQFTSDANHSAEDYVVSDANRQAYALLVQEVPWHSYALVLVGPRASGKSHLSDIWARTRNAKKISASALKDVGFKDIYFVVEDLEALKDEEALFHLFNHVVQMRGKLLLTCDRLPEQLPIALPDLKSRVKAAQVVQISLPDDGLLKTLLVKQFSDLQLRVGSEVVTYLLSRMPRSFGAVKEVVTALDKTSLEQRRNITVALAREVLEKTFGPGSLL